MNKLVLAALIACGGHARKSPISSSSACPIPTDPEVAARFAVGVEPRYRVPDYRTDHGMLCLDTFRPGRVIAIKNGKLEIVAEGTFTGSCTDAPGERAFEAVRAARVGIEVDGLASSEGELGMDKPVTLDERAPDKMASVAALPVDRCGDKLSEGESKLSTTWTLGDGCDKVVRLVPWTLDGPADPTADAMQIAAVGPGTCTVRAAMLGAKGELQVTVK